MDKDIEKKSNSKPKQSSAKNRGSQLFEYCSNIVVHLIFIYIVFQLSSWLSFLTSSFSAIAWLLAISYIANIVANVIYLFFDPIWFKSLSQLAINIFNLVVFYSMLIIFPFNLNTANQLIAHIIIYVIIFGTAVAVIVEMSKLLKFLLSYEREAGNGQ